MPYVFLVLAIVAVYFPMGRVEFVNLDDPVYLTENPLIGGTVSRDWFVQSLKGSDVLNLWHPVTWWSHYGAAACFGVGEAWPHRVLQVVFFTGSILLAFKLLLLLTGRLELSFWVAVLVAVHPQRVEVVSWVSARKDVLVGMFSLGCLVAWVRWREGGSRWMAGVVFGSALMAFMSKPLAVMLPAAVVGVEWYLRRMGRVMGRWPWRSLGLLALGALGLAVLTMRMQTGGGHSALGEWMPWTERARLMPWGWWFYLRTAVWPFPSMLFREPPGWDISFKVEAIAGLLVFAALSIGVWRAAARQPLLALGWGWFVLWLIPVMGWVPVSVFFVADRYSYLPSMGLGLMAVAVAGRWIRRRWMRLAVAGGVLVLMGLSSKEAKSWTDSGTLFARELRVNPRSALGAVHYGGWLIGSAEYGKALPILEEARKWNPAHGLLMANLGEVYFNLGRVPEAVACWRAAIASRDRMGPKSWLRLAAAGMEKGPDGHAEAERLMREALVRCPDQRVDVLLALADFQGFVKRDRPAGLAVYEEILGRNPDNRTALRNSALLLAELGRNQEAAVRLRIILRKDPGELKLLELLRRLEG